MGGGCTQTSGRKVVRKGEEKRGDNRGGVGGGLNKEVVNVVWCVLAPSLLNDSMDWVLDRAVAWIHREAFVCNIGITGLNFTDDAVIFA